MLPFDNFSGDPAQARLADGITEDIITNLARFRDLDVIARNTTMTYKGKAVDVKQVGKDLGVRYVLEGSLQRAGERVRVTAQLIDATTGAHVWSERWDRPAGDVFAVQTEVAEKVGSTLAGYTGLIGEADRMRAKRERPENLAAYDLYLLGVEAKHRLTKESVAEAIRLHRRATELDPGFACAWMGLAWALQVSRRWADDAERPELARQALAAAERAVQLDPMDAEAHAALGSTFGINGDLIQCAAELRKALDLNPSSADILTFYADWASSFGEPEGGAAAADRAIRLNPNLPLWSKGTYGYAYFMVGRYEDALRYEREIPEESRGRNDLVRIAASLAALGRKEEATAAVGKLLARAPNFSTEAYLSDPEWGEAERQRLAATMRAAGFPVCAGPERMVDIPPAQRLPECDAERAKAAAPRT